MADRPLPSSGTAPAPAARAERAPDARGSKQPVSTLVLVYTPSLEVLLLERADFPGYWQSVTGSREDAETLEATATRELAEETGIDAAAFGGVSDWHMTNVFEIYPKWRARFAPGVTHNAEHVYALGVPGPVPVRLQPREHLAHAWLPWRTAAERVFSWSNRAAILALPSRASRSDR
ncbi:MAG: dihydroneopterin triphosphate diphosphatase [Burkholderiales bacterium]|nr:dihydroneopterin triphosphate diphosphatase [Burkholderiales bacterium]